MSGTNGIRDNNMTKMKEDETIQEKVKFIFTPLMVND